MEAIMSRRSSTYSQWRKPRKHLNNFCSSNHTNLFKTPHSPNTCFSASSSGLHHRQRPYSFFHPSPSSIAAKDDVNAAKRLKISRRKEAITAAMAVECLIITSTNRLGPDPSELPKEIPTVLKSALFSTSINDDPEKFSGSVCSHSPPPSSLPLPKFSKAQKVGCNAEAVGIDIGATNHLRCLLGI